jgi:hypothetical protein
MDNFETEEDFKAYLFREFDVVDNPKADACYNLAYEYGHSQGYSEVHYVFSDLVALIK